MFFFRKSEPVDVYFSFFQELELVEEPQCQKVFSAFLRFLYCNHILLHPDNALPILVLADKYNVNNLRKVYIARFRIM